MPSLTAIDYTCPDCMVLPKVPCRWDIGGGMTEARPGCFHTRRLDMQNSMADGSEIDFTREMSKEGVDRAFQGAIDGLG